MIIKKVKSKGGSSKAGRVKSLTDYITDEKGKDKDKIAYSGGRGFIGDSFICHQAEMIALADDAPRSTNPIAHWVVSWKEDEQPSREQVEEAIDILLEELDLKDHQAIYAVHQDTDNVHLHLAVNRVNPDTLKVIKSGGGFDVELAHKAIAKIEDLQGWQREERGRYQVVDGTTQRVQHPAKTTQEPSQRAQPIEIYQGIKSAERIAIEQGADPIRAAHSWSDLHQSLADLGMRYEQYGSGAYLYVGETKLKASSVGRDCSLPNLQKRLGQYQPPGVLVVAKVQPQLMDGLSKERQKYIKQRANYETARQASRIERKERQIQELRELQADQRTRREELVAGDWRGRGELLNALRSEIASEQEKERAELGERQRAEMEGLKIEPFPDFENWLSRENQRQIQVDAERQSEAQERKRDRGFEMSM